VAATDSATGNRYDRAVSDYRVWYFATSREGCYGETLASFRPDPQLADIEEEDQMAVGDIPADWRANRVALKATFPEGRVFLDVEDATTRNSLRVEPLIAPVLTALSREDLDVSDVRSGDRRLTRWISEWAWEQEVESDSGQAAALAGVRFLSRHNSDWECWAVFEDVVVEPIEQISILPTDSELLEVAKLYGLNIY